jgi:hypothetical protein
MTSDKTAGFIDRAKRLVNENPMGAASLAMGTYFGARIGQQHGATAAGVAGSLAGVLAGDKIMRKAWETGDPRVQFGAAIGSAFLPLYTAQIAARVMGDSPQEVAQMRAQGHKLAAYDAGVIDGMEKIAEAWQRKEGKNPEGGLNAKGRASLRAKGQDIKRPVSAREAKRSPKAAKRRKSFCARMSGMPGPMKDDKGRPTRKALSLRKWDC